MKKGMILLLMLMMPCIAVRRKFAKTAIID